MQTLVREIATKQTVLALLATHPWCFACAVPAASIAKSSSFEAADNGGTSAFHYTDRRGPARRSIVMRTADAGVHAKTISSSSFAATGQQYPAADLIYTVSGSAVSWNA
jgi:hypothetical protein